MSAIFPVTRMRRLRRSVALRDLVRETTVSMNDLIQPIFVEEEIDSPIPIPTMPGISRIPEQHLAAEIEALARLGLKSVMLFGISHHKDHCGSDTWNPDGLVARMLRTAKHAVPDMVVIPDICFCEYTDHGHCGVLDQGHVANDATLANLVKQAVVAAESGADILAPSGMMDGQVQAIRAGLDKAGFLEIPIMAYASKFESALYGPFRVASECTLQGNRKTYQLDPMNGRAALREALLDEAEGADFLMVKPGTLYLDVLHQLRQRTLLPLAAYQVGGEYAMIKFAALSGALDERSTVLETLGAFKRAGADLIVSYFARDVAGCLDGRG
ncbi:porphobilinogen synthase [Rhodospirillum rubrum]|uniref:porphobilinogen synthase n=1 Tax=Rhodospirillum rubrum TaxID=1085 RepID=UPI001908D28B|nr:porphobilinogen synthase [Rhodospirillum rubrum]MBK1664790.1 porphobilinogen synthase [Rhodospirillum rubrum]MBK1676694.1 porphobilinogen synthase [Rhodospirillum rubrum]